MQINYIKDVQLAYGDISLKPNKCIVESRRFCETEMFFGGFTFEAPVYPSNMKSVVDEDTCEYLAEKNWFYTMHRFSDKGVVPLKWYAKMKEQKLVTSISLGINQDSKDILDYIKDDNSPDFITIDVANAWYDRVKDMAKLVKDKIPNAFLIVGNVATSEAVRELQDWGTVDAIKVGIASGKTCITKNKTGFHRPMASTISDCYGVAEVPLIADGGIKEHGDIAKSIACGATMVMAGYLFAGYDKSAGGIIEIEDREYKEYFGSASKFNKEEAKNIEGKKILIPYRGDMDKLLVEIKEDLQSSISYAGGTELEDLYKAHIYEV